MTPDMKLPIPWPIQSQQQSHHDQQLQPIMTKTKTKIKMCTNNTVTVANGKLFSLLNCVPDQVFCYLVTFIQARELFGDFIVVCKSFFKIGMKTQCIAKNTNPKHFKNTVTYSGNPDLNLTHKTLNKLCFKHTSWQAWPMMHVLSNNETMGDDIKEQIIKNERGLINMLQLLFPQSEKDFEMEQKIFEEKVKIFQNEKIIVFQHTDSEFVTDYISDYNIDTDHIKLKSIH